MVYIFVSYSIADSNKFQISKIAEDLTKFPEIENTLYCEEDAREDFIKYMNDYIEKSDIMILFCSENSKNSKFVSLEWRAALSLEKKIIPVFINPKHVPPLLSSMIGAEFNEFDYNSSLKNIYHLILKNLTKSEDDLKIQAQILTKPKAAFRGKLVNKNEIKNLKRMQGEINNLIEKFEVNADGSVISLDLSPIYLQKIPKSILFFPNLIHINFSEDSFENDEGIRRLVFNGVIVKIEGKPYEDGQVEARKKRREELEKSGKENQEIVNQAQGFILSGEWDTAIKLLRRSREICVHQGWSSGVDYADKIILESEKYKKEETEKKLKKREKMLITLKKIPLEEETALFELEKLLKRKFNLSIEPPLNKSMTFTIENNNVIALDLYKCKLNNFPEEILIFTKLKYLNLKRNQIVNLPDSIGLFKSLKLLRLSNNMLNCIPKSISKLKALKTLDLSNNQLKTLPKSLSELGSLEYLDLNNNEFSDFPNSILNISILKTLYLNFNNIYTIPESLGNMSSLETLYLNFNNIRSIPESIGKLKFLQYLNLRDNYLSDLPSSLTELNSIQTLVLTGNNFKTLPWQATFLERRNVEIII